MTAEHYPGGELNEAPEDGSGGAHMTTTEDLSADRTKILTEYVQSKVAELTRGLSGEAYDIVAKDAASLAESRVRVIWDIQDTAALRREQSTP
jgi:hypothetical protein